MESGTNWSYGYTGTTNDPPPWNNFWKQNGSLFGPPIVVSFDIVNSLTDRYEVMAYAGQSYTTALGATPSVGRLAANLPLINVWPSPDPLGNNFASHFYHSAEFRGDGVWQWSYWNTLLYSKTLGFNILNQ